VAIADHRPPRRRSIVTGPLAGERPQTRTRRLARRTTSGKRKVAAERFERPSMK